MTKQDENREQQQQNNQQAEEELGTGHQSGEEGSEEAGEQEVPFWLKQEEEPDSSGSEGKDGGDDDGGDDDGARSESGDVPVATHVKVKQKLKAKLKDADDELTKLRKKVAEFESGQGSGQQPQSGLKPPKRPRRSDFEDDDAYETAMDDYEVKRDQYLTQHVSQSSQQTQEIQQRRKQIEKSVDDHYTRAENIVKKYGIKPEIYQHADATVKEIIQQALPKLDPEIVFNGMVDLLGEGSEMTMFHIGKDKQAAAEFERRLRSDPSGLSAVAYLGRITGQAVNPKGNRNSQAPAPPARLKGDEASTVKGKAAHKKWQEAHSKGRTQEAYNIKQSAKKQGIDVSNWN